MKRAGIIAICVVLVATLAITAYAAAPAGVEPRAAGGRAITSPVGIEWAVTRNGQAVTTVDQSNPLQNGDQVTITVSPTTGYTNTNATYSGTVVTTGLQLVSAVNNTNQEPSSPLSLSCASGSWVRYVYTVNSGTTSAATASFQITNPTLVRTYANASGNLPSWSATVGSSAAGTTTAGGDACGITLARNTVANGAQLATGDTVNLTVTSSQDVIRASGWLVLSGMEYQSSPSSSATTQIPISLGTSSTATYACKVTATTGSVAANFYGSTGYATTVTYSAQPATWTQAIGAPTPYSVTLVQPAPAVGTISAAGVSNLNAVYPGTTVTIMANLASGAYLLNQWNVTYLPQGSGTPQTVTVTKSGSNDNIATFVMPPGPVTVSANFTSRVYHNVNLGATTNGILFREPNTAAEGDVVTVWAEPVQGYQLRQINAFNDLTGSAISLVAIGGSTTRFSFLMPNAPVTVTASFMEGSSPTPTPTPTEGADHSITVSAATHGTVSAGAASAEAGTTVSVRVSPAENYALGTLSIRDASGQAVTVTPVGSSGTQYSFVMPNSAVTISATFMWDSDEPEPTPTPTPSATATATATATSTATASPSATATASPSATATRTASPTPTATPTDGPITQLPDGITVAPSSDVEFVREGTTIYMEGLVAGARGHCTTPTTLLQTHLRVEDDVEVQVLTSGGNPVSSSSPIATGDLVEFSRDGQIILGTTVVVEGDVQGNGVMSLTQLARLAAIYRGDAALPRGAFLMAVDFDSNGRITLLDLVREAALYRAAM